MDERGLWHLFWKTGLPEAYLAVIGQRLEDEREQELPARTAFRPRREEA